MVPSANLPSSDPALPGPPVSDKKVPKSEKANIKKGANFLDLVVKYDLGEEAFIDTFDGAVKLWQKVRIVIGKVAVGLDGKVTTRWAKIPLAKKLSIISTLHKAAPWLHTFEDCWAAEWLLSKAINQRVTDRNRGAKKMRQKEMISQFAQSTAASLSHNPSSSSPPSSSPPPRSSPPTLSSLPPRSSSPLPPSSPPLPSSLLPSGSGTSAVPLLSSSVNQQIQLLQEQLNFLIRQQQQQQPTRIQVEKEATPTTPTIVNIEGDEEATALPDMPIETASRTGNLTGANTQRNTRRKGASKLYQDAIGLERQSEDEREVRRATKVRKRQRKQTTGQELDGLMTELGMEAGDSAEPAK
jgi:hypothetical protein